MRRQSNGALTHPRPLPAEEILDDGVGLLLESSGDSPDDDLELFGDAAECRKVSLAFL